MPGLYDGSTRSDKAIRRGPTRSLLKRMSLIPAGVSLLTICLSGCGITLVKQEVGYYFSHPILNERWKPDNLYKGKGRSVASKKKSRSSKSKEKKHSVAVEVPAQELRGEDVSALRAEMVTSARRLLGIHDSFNSDSFLRHILYVNNLGIGKLPQENTVRWLQRRGGVSTAKITLQAGDVVFLGEEEAEYAVVVESVDTDGTVTFIGILDGVVARGVLSLEQPSARRNESDRKVLNSFLGKSRPAGELVLGAFSLAGYHERFAAQKE